MTTLETAARPVEILLVEDNPADARLVRETLKDGRMETNLTVARDGVEAIERLADAEHYRPDLILLDLNLPRKNGLEVLEEIKQHESLRSIPVIVMTTSESDQDILRAYNLHANAFITKPVDLDQFTEVVRKTEDFWFTIVRHPLRRG
ncbi:MAG: response regulator [Bacteroidetes bacterium]|jgi:CheY-like chemotaxis protein|nr:response regulator [Bacteroidota bacterium]